MKSLSKPVQVRRLERQITELKEKLEKWHWGNYDLECAIFNREQAIKYIKREKRNLPFCDVCKKFGVKYFNYY